MAVRKDEVQLSINFITDESKQYAKLINQNKAFIKELNRAKRKGEDMSATINKIVRSGQSLQGIDLSRLLPSQLLQRARQISQAMRLIPQSAPQYKLLQAELKGINDQLAKQRAATRGVAKGMQVASRATRIWNNALSLLGAGTIAGVIFKLVDWGKQLFSLGEAQESFAAKFEVVFEEAGTIVEDFAEKNARALGLAREEYKGLAANVGDLLKPMGFTAEETAKLSTQIVNQGAVLAQWSDRIKDPAEATSILNKALLGEREALNSLGIDIKQSLVNDKLKEQGLDKLTGSSLRQAEALITLQLITEQSTSANEAFEKGTNKLAQQKADLRAQLQELVQRLARGFVPVAQKALEVILPLIEGIVHFGGRLVQAYQRAENFRAVVSGVFRAVGSIIKSNVEALTSFGEGFLALFEGDFSGAVERFKNSFSAIGDIGQEAGKAFAEGFVSVKSPAPEIDTSGAEAEGRKLATAYNADFLAAQFEDLRQNGTRATKETAQGMAGLRAEIKQLQSQLEEVEDSGAYVRLVQKIGRLTDELEANQRRLNNAVIEAAGGTISPEALPIREIEDAGREVLGILSDLGIDAEAAVLDRQKSIDAQLVAFSKRTAAELVQINLDKNEKMEQRETERLEKQKALEQQLFDTFGSGLEAGIELLSKNEEARRKNAEKIKALQIGKVTIDGIREIQGIFASFSTLGPAGQILAAVQAGIAAARTGAAISKIKAQEFAKGGYTGLSGQRINRRPNIPTRPNGDNILATVRRGEVILNAAQQAALGGPSVFQRIGVPGFAAGGTVPNTTPTPAPVASPNNGNGQEALAAIADLRKDFQEYAERVEAWQRQFKVSVSYLDIEEVGGRLADVREDASL